MKTNPLTLWITGAGGMLGQDLQALARARGHQVLATDRDVDITDTQAVRSFIQEHKPDCLINCAAYTAVDKAETETALNFHINSDGPAVLASCAAEAGIVLAHVSTDYVLNGAAPDPLKEDAPYDPQNAYGRAKAEGEQRLAACGGLYYIVRTAWLYGEHGNNFVSTMLRLMGEKESLTVVDDQWGNPTWTVDLAAALLALCENRPASGIYHCTGEGIVSWHGFACEIQRQALELGLLGKTIPVSPVPSSAYVTPAKRPAWSALDKSKIAACGVQMPAWQQSLRSYLEREKASRHG